MEKFGSGIAGRTFKKGSTVFMVMEVDPYPKDRISPPYREKLTALPPQQLVSVSYRGTHIPNITVSGGVVRLTKVAVGGVVLSSPKAISEALGIKTALHPYTIERA